MHHQVERSENQSERDLQAGSVLIDFFDRPDLVDVEDEIEQGADDDNDAGNQKRFDFLEVSLEFESQTSQVFVSRFHSQF